MEPTSAVVVGMCKHQILCTPADDLKEISDFEHRLPTKQWWLKLRSLTRILGQHEAIYMSEVIRNDELLEDTDENE
jgi:6-phosphofructokinase 1